MFWMRAYLLRGEVGGGLALEFGSFLSPVKWQWADSAIWGPKNSAFSKVPFLFEDAAIDPLLQECRIIIEQQ